jgi:hypothetical protein
MKGKVLEFKRPASEAEIDAELADYARRALMHERAVSAGAMARHQRIIIEAELRRELLTIGERHGL